MYESRVLSSNVEPKMDKKEKQDGEDDTERRLLHVIRVCTGLSYS